MRSLELESGLTLLAVPTPRSTIVHRLVCDRLADRREAGESGAGASAYWIDARNAAAPRVLYDQVSSPGVLSDLRIARAFTAYQHHSLVREVTRRCDPTTELLVAPNVASLYGDDDLPAYEREDLLASSLETLSELGRVLDCPVVVTSADDERAATIDDYARSTIECVRTREGVRFETDGEAVTTGYWHGTYWQTTIPYWVDCCGTVDRLDPVTAADRGLLEVSA
ncbi:hypothetical protein [Natrarchaeobius oligotrophus]|nr:hypothetical protein [Natrarchaeobius chitinivorans]